MFVHIHVAMQLRKTPIIPGGPGMFGFLSIQKLIHEQFYSRNHYNHNLAPIILVRLQVSHKPLQVCLESLNC